jgi:hypothetical protein
LAAHSAPPATAAAGTTGRSVAPVSFHSSRRYGRSVAINRKEIARGLVGIHHENAYNASVTHERFTATRSGTNGMSGPIATWPIAGLS